MNLPNPMNHVLVDFGNVCDIDATILDNGSVKLVLLVGAIRKTLDLVEKLLPHAAAVQLVRLTSSGKNALDFALAYYLGCSATTDPRGPFYKNIQGQGIRSSRGAPAKQATPRQSPRRLRRSQC